MSDFNDARDLRIGRAVRGHLDAQRRSKELDKAINQATRWLRDYRKRMNQGTIDATRGDDIRATATRLGDSIVVLRTVHGDLSELRRELEQLRVPAFDDDTSV